MATVIFGAVGTLVGGPIGGALGALIGRQVDGAIMGGGTREGPRLRELATTTSSYGSPIVRPCGTVREPGSIIWATELKETSETSGGGKGSPEITQYRYSASFAVALASVPVAALGRIWADGNLLRGTAGDLKVPGTLRFYDGRGDQPVDPLIAADMGEACPAFRGLAYVVLEDLALGEFGGRIPALTFELIGDEVGLALADLTGEEIAGTPDALAGLVGFTVDGGPIGRTLEAIDTLYPLAVETGTDTVRVAADFAVSHVKILPPPVALAQEDGFAPHSGTSRRRAAGNASAIAGIRYYDRDRDYQPGLQRVDRRADSRARVVDFPGVLAAQDARDLANAAEARRETLRETLLYRLAEIDGSLLPGARVRVPGRSGIWRIASWELRAGGVELELVRIGPGRVARPLADAGPVLEARDTVAGPTLLCAFEVPFAPPETGAQRHIAIAASSADDGWKGAALYGVRQDRLEPLGPSGARRAVTGTLATALGPSPALILERDASVEVRLDAADRVLIGADPTALDQGANRAWIGGEIIQFAQAQRIDGERWRLRGLLRGRGATERAAQTGAALGNPFVLLDANVRFVPVAETQADTGAIAALGLGDAEPVYADIADRDAAVRPLVPVHARRATTADGGIVLRWYRRARASFVWSEGGDVPLSEPVERYRVGIGTATRPALYWDLAEPRLTLTATQWSRIVADHAGAPVWVRQIGALSQSAPLLLSYVAQDLP